MAAIGEWKKEVLRQLFISADYRKQRNALRFQVEQGTARERRLYNRLTGAEKLLNSVHINHFTRRPPPMPTPACAVFLRNHHQLSPVPATKPLLLTDGGKDSV